MDDLISVIVPLYNVSSYLRECIESIRHQTYTKLEILLIDDGSTDDSGALCDLLAAEDSRIRVIHKDNGGSAEAKNVGIEQAQGDYLTIIDADDKVKDDYVEVLYRELKAHDADISIVNYYAYNEWTNEFLFYVLDDYFEIEELDSCEAIRRQAHWHYNASAFIVPWGKLYKRELFTGVRYPKGRSFDDEGTTHRLYMNSQKIVLVNGNYYMYRIRKNSQMTSALGLKQVRDLLAIFNQKLADLALARMAIPEMRLRYINLLQDYKFMMEANNLVETDEYQSILFQLHQVSTSENRKNEEY